MSHFEFVVVAISLVYASALSDSIRVGVSAFQSSEKHWPYLLWFILVPVMIIFAWHATWNSRAVSWTGLLFLYSMSAPLLIAIIARLVTQRHSGLTQAEHYSKIRNPLYVFTFAIALLGSLAAWVQGIYPWGQFAPIQLGSVPGILFGICGLLDRKQRWDVYYICCLLTVLLVALAVIPTRVVT